MNGFGYDPYMMGGNSPYSYGMQNSQQNNDPNQPPEQQSFVESLRTLVSGLSAITGISYGFSTLFTIFYKTLKYLNIFKGKKTTQDLLDQVWRETGRSHSNKGFWAKIKYFLIGVIIVAQ